MKNYIEPKMEMITYFVSDIIASSQSTTHGTETGNEFDHSEYVVPETSLPDWIAPVSDDDW